jgi:hypothetical protein
MNKSRSNIGWMPIMSGKSSRSKTWSWQNIFRRIISSKVDETSIVYSKVYFNDLMMCSCSF